MSTVSNTKTEPSAKPVEATSNRTRPHPARKIILRIIGGAIALLVLIVIARWILNALNSVSTDDA